MPRIYDVFDVPKVKSMRAITKIRQKVDINDVLSRLPGVKSVRTSDKKVVRFELSRGSYLLLFPTGYIEMHTPDEVRMREILVAFRDALYEHGLI